MAAALKVGHDSVSITALRAQRRTTNARSAIPKSKLRLATPQPVQVGASGAHGQSAAPSAMVVLEPENETAPTPNVTSATSWP